MNYINYRELVIDVTNMSFNLPKFDLVVGIPRSGLVPATILALHWNVPVTTPQILAGYGLTIGSGERMRERLPDKIKNVLVIDDSHFTGKSMKEARLLLENSAYNWSSEKINFKYAAVYSSNQNHDLDYCYKYVAQPRWFEWNWLHHDKITKACFDMDGVLCRPPTVTENDYGPKYEEFLLNTTPRYIPTLPIRAIITGRLEKYRGQTEKWLKDHGIEYQELIMRVDRNTSIIDHKSYHYSKILDSHVFIEDEQTQAQTIAEKTGKNVICTTIQHIYRG